jgi:pentatricopeptide repeat protein
MFLIAALTLRTTSRPSLFVLGFLTQDHAPAVQHRLHTKREWQGFEMPVIGHQNSKVHQSMVNQAVCESDQENYDPQEKLKIYVHNLQKYRKKRDTKTAKSLSHFLMANPLVKSFDSEGISQSCERALTQAIRTAGDVGDYKLILNLVNGAIAFANGNPILTPRIFGEALDALAQTGANVAKLKQIWKLVAEGSDFLQSPLTAFELNVMLKSLASRAKFRSCIDIYRQHAVQNSTTLYTFIQPDAYTASTLFSILTDSISTNQPATTPLYMRYSPSSSGLEYSLKKLSKSPCWQWNTAVELLSTFSDNLIQWNNHAYSALLKLQDRAKEVFDDHESVSSIALAILNSMGTNGVIPDVVTCTLAIKAIGNPDSNSNSWKLAVRFLEQMTTDEKLPNPNAYSYSAAIVACARCREYDTALGLLNKMKKGKIESSEDVDATELFVPPEPNTWVYNAALLAVGNPEPTVNRRRQKEGKSSQTQEAEDRRKLALSLLEQMKNDNSYGGMDTKPDTVTYNTILGILGTTRDKNAATKELVLSLINSMKQENVSRDVITYHNSILACPESSDILLLLHLCLKDGNFKSNSSGAKRNSRSSPKSLKGKAAHGLTFVFNAGLSILASKGDLKMFRVVFLVMQTENIPLNQETISHLLTIVGRSGNSDTLIRLLAALESGEPSIFLAEKFYEKTGIEIAVNKLPPLEIVHYSTAICACLTENQLDHAQSILLLMRENNMIPNAECMESFALAYARSAIRAAAKEEREIRRGETSNLQLISRNRAQSAFSVAMALNDPPPFVLSTVAKACVNTRQWKRAGSMLRSLQKSILSNDINDVRLRQGSLVSLSDLQSSLLRECAKQGNVTAALWYANDIQRFSRKLVSNKDDQSSVIVPAIDCNDSETDFLGVLRDLSLTEDFKINVGMRARDWVSLMKAARRSGHWRLCVNTLQFLRPYVERTNPKPIKKEGGAGKLKTRYKHLAPALVEAIRCLEIRSQYAWSVRAINEWMSWSGRKVPPEAALSTIRVLSSRGRGEEVKKLLRKCVGDDLTEDYSSKEVTYEEMLYIGAVTSLHLNGLYDDADEIYVSGVSEGHLPFVLESQSEKVVLDLHGLNVAMAHSAVRVAMRQQTAISNERSTSDMMIITGRGRNSAIHLRPVLRPEIQRMLVEEFYPPLNTLSMPGNMGALLVLADDISRWQEHQEGQKGARMLALAAVLKDFSTNRLRQSIALLEANKDD